VSLLSGVITATTARAWRRRAGSPPRRHLLRASRAAATWPPRSSWRDADRAPVGRDDGTIPAALLLHQAVREGKPIDVPVRAHLLDARTVGSWTTISPAGKCWPDAGSAPWTSARRDAGSRPAQIIGGEAQLRRGRALRSGTETRWPPAVALLPHAMALVREILRQRRRRLTLVRNLMCTEGSS